MMVKANEPKNIIVADKQPSKSFFKLFGTYAALDKTQLITITKLDTENPKMFRNFIDEFAVEQNHNKMNLF